MRIATHDHRFWTLNMILSPQVSTLKLNLNIVWVKMGGNEWAMDVLL
jgi:hypothetical protein